MEKIYKFPEGFHWGSASAAEETEARGNSPELNQPDTSFSYFHKKNPGFFHEGLFAQNDFWLRYEEDLDLAKQMNFKSVRLSVSWTRLLPDGKNVDLDAVEHYKKIFDSVHDKGMELFLTLFHFEMPSWALLEGGFASKKVRENFILFAKTAFEHFNGYVDYWATFNEALAHVLATHIRKRQPHVEEYTGLEFLLRATYNVAVAHAKAAELFEEMNVKGKFGCVYVGSEFIPRSEHPLDVEACDLAESLLWESFVDTAVFGVYPQKVIDYFEAKGLWPEGLIEDGDKELFKNSKKLEWIGINYYLPIRIASTKLHPGDEEAEGYDIAGQTDDWFTDEPSGINLFTLYMKPGVRMNIHRGFEINPESLYNRLVSNKEKYNNIPQIITENGMGVENEERFRDENGRIEDTYRIKFINEHLYWIWKAIDEGANVFGYHQWTWIDNWSWTNAYKNRYGYVELNLETNDRIKKHSFDWISKVSKDNEIVCDIEKFGEELGDQ